MAEQDPVLRVESPEAIDEALERARALRMLGSSELASKCSHALGAVRKYREDAELVRPSEPFG